MWKNEQEQLIFDYVLAEQILKRGVAGEEEAQLRTQMRKTGAQLDLKNPATTRKCIAVSKGIVNRRNMLYKSLVEKCLSIEDCGFLEHYVYMCIQKDIEPSPDRILQIKFLI